MNAPPEASGIVHRIPLPNPFFEGEINTWLIVDRPLTLVDAGLNSEESLVALRSGLDKLGFRIEQIERLILTHRHPDHVGLARKIVEFSSAQVWIHSEDRVVFDDPVKRAAEFPDRLADGLGAWGAPHAVLDPVVDFFRHSSVIIPEVDTHPLSDAQVLPCERSPIVVHHTPGHSLGHVTLQYADHLLVGDHVLERITPNIGSGEFHARGSLRKYLQGLQKVASLCSDRTIACPGHGPAFRTLPHRARVIAEHHDERETDVLNILKRDRSATVYDMARALFGTMDSVHLMLGMGEAFAHLDKLHAEGRIQTHHGKFQLA
ncbi:MAG: MBL fold metallo-hydrolase [Planctomycetaceae bacterium]|nr:MBL fold metallo-hydrolase [Planctomycetaceae bacterium]